MKPLQEGVSDANGGRFTEDNGVRNGVEGCAQLEENDDNN